MKNYSTEQLQKILDDAPDGAVFWSVRESSYYEDTRHYVSVWGDIKLSDIRAELLARQFKVGDLVVIVNKPNASMELHLVLEPTNSTSVGVAPINRLSGQPILMCQQLASPRYLRHATAEEEAAGHRIDEPEKMMTRESLLPPLRNTPVKFLNDEQLSELTKNTDFSSVAHVQLKHKPDTITTQLDPAKCRAVDPTVYDAPTDSPRDDFDAMSESHRQPGCKCHEFPFDAELEVPMVASQQQIGGDHYTKLAIQPMHYSMANKLNPAQHTIIKYVTRYPDKGGIQDLLKARHTIDLLIERLEGE